MAESKESGETQVIQYLTQADIEELLRRQDSPSQKCMNPAYLKDCHITKVEKLQFTELYGITFLFDHIASTLCVVKGEHSNDILKYTRPTAKYPNYSTATFELY